MSNLYVFAQETALLYKGDRRSECILTSVMHL